MSSFAVIEFLSITALILALVSGPGAVPATSRARQP